MKRIGGRIGVMRFQVPRQVVGDVERLADDAEIARAAAVQRQARQGARLVRQRAHQLAQGVTQVAARQQPVDRIEPGIDVLRAGQGARQARQQQAPAARGHGLVQCRDQAAFALALLGAIDFQAAAGGRVDAEHVAR